MWKRIAALFSIGNTVLCGCYKNHLYVQQEKVDQNFLASTHIHTPDPRQEDPPCGQRLLIAWNFPVGLFREGLTLVTTVRLWDQSEQKLTYQIDRMRGNTAYYFPNNELGKDQRILTYRVQVVSKGEVIETWEHQFWTELIDVDRFIY